METHRLALTAGYRLEHYQIERILGKGGFGITYEAIDTHLGKRVAIKELLPDSIATRVEGSTVVPQTTSMEDSWAWAKERFLEEARFLAGFSHPAIVGVHRLIETNGTAYMVMDYVEGESYETRLRRIGKEPDQASLMAVMGPIMEGIEELHAKNLLHRDIKPDNILIDKRGKPVLIDFGSARTSVGATMTMTSMVTHGYSPIEQYQTKGRMGQWTDIYAIGAVMCRAITGEKPPVAADRVIEDDFQWVSNRKPAGYDETFLNAVDWALRVRVEDRPQNISAFTRHIRHTPTPSTPPPVPSPPPLVVEPAPVVSNPIPKKEKNNNLKGFLILVIAVSVPVFYFLGANSNNAPSSEESNKKESPEELYQVAMKYIAGDGVEKDGSKGIELLKKSANQGYAAAQIMLAGCYELGYEIEKNPTEAVKWVRKAADQGSAEAQVGLGNYYLNGEGVEKNPAEAVKWYRKAAQQGNSDAMTNLGSCYLDGEGVEKNLGEAVRLFRKAAEQGSAGAQHNLGLCYLNGWGVKKNPSEAVKWLLKGSDQGWAAAQNSLGYCYANGIGVEMNLKEAVKLFRKAAEQGNLDAKTNLQIFD
jgi:TPR repeat protein